MDVIVCVLIFLELEVDNDYNVKFMDNYFLSIFWELGIVLKI